MYLAVQESVDREVALKVMSPALLADPNFGERFQREARIAARLHHRHVVGIHDVGRQGDYHYIAMEYLSAGPVLSKDGQPRSVPFALRVIREIATALGYAQQKGFIHRDVKPDNILLRDDGSSALTDFGIARASDSATRMTRTGAVVGTPHYMSPEQARGKQIDGRSDLYSLGIVLYEMLVGRVPYHAEDSLAVGIMHITQPVPKLPEALEVLQPLVDGLLAKEAEDRFQTGHDAATAIARYEKAIASGELEGLDGEPEGFARDVRSMDTSVSPATPPMPSMRASRHSPPDGAPRASRAEPNLGRLDEIMAATDEHILRASRSGRHAAARAPKRRRGGWIAAAIVAGVLVVAGAATWRNQDRLRALLPNTELNTVLARAQQALDAGRLSGTQGDSARELFQQARSIDPDNDLARSGLAEVGRRLLDDARAALARDDVATASRLVADARELLGGGAEVDALAKQVGDRQSQGDEIEGLLDQARQALAAGRLLDKDGAASLYARVAAADPGNALARAGTGKVAEALAAQAGEAIDKGDEATAMARIEAIARIVPDHPGLPELRARVTRQREDAAAALEADLAKAEAHLRGGRASGAGDTAQALFESVLARDRDNVRARAGLRRVAQALVVQASAAIDDGNADAAERLLGQAERLSPELADLRSARVGLRELRERAAIAAARPTLTPADEQRLQRLVADANLAADNGRLIEPPGNCAYDKFRAALAIDGGNTAALAGLEKLPARARDLFDASLRDGDLPRARGMIDAVRQLAPSDASLGGMNERLATAYLDQADARIGANEGEDAARAIDAARQLAPSSPRLAPLEQKLRAWRSANGRG